MDSVNTSIAPSSIVPTIQTKLDSQTGVPQGVVLCSLFFGMTKWLVGGFNTSINEYENDLNKFKFTDLTDDEYVLEGEYITEEMQIKEDVLNVHYSNLHSDEFIDIEEVLNEILKSSLSIKWGNITSNSSMKLVNFSWDSPIKRGKSDDFIITKSEVKNSSNQDVCKIVIPQIWITKLIYGYFGCCTVVTALGNTFILILPLLNKSFRSPVFITLQSFSVISIIHAVEMLIYTIFYCEKKPSYFLPIRSFASSYIRNIYLLHLLILAGQRIFITLFPLKAKVYHTKYNTRFLLVFVCFSFLIYEIIMPVAVPNRSIRSKLLSVKDVELVVMNGVTCSLLITAMLTSAIKTCISKNLQTSNQKTQSRVASIVIIVYITLSCPISLAGPIFSNSCHLYEQNLVYEAIEFLGNVLEIFILTINPIMLCLRSKKVRETLTSQCRSCNK